MEQLLLFALFYERMLENAAQRQRRIPPPAEPLEPILWSRVGELKVSDITVSAPQKGALLNAGCYGWASREPLAYGDRA